jgi:hypothetical protein
MATTMATLTGSEKQVAWANEIRSATMAALAAHLPAAMEVLSAQVANGDAKARRRLAIARGLEAALAQQTSASWWLANRHYIALAVDPRPDMANYNVRKVLAMIGVIAFSKRQLADLCVSLAEA